MISNNGAWPYTVNEGDVLESGKGVLRVVRKATQGKNGLTIYVTFAIKRCSWTGRGITCYNYIDLKNLGYFPTGLAVPLKTRKDKILRKETYAPYPSLISCCEAKVCP